MVAYCVAVGVAVEVAVGVEVAVIVAVWLSADARLFPVIANITPPHSSDNAIMPPNNSSNGLTGFRLRSSGISIGFIPGSAMTK